MTEVLFLHGGWQGHFPSDVAGWASGIMDELGWDVDHIEDPHRLGHDLTGYDLIVIGWTQAMTTEGMTKEAEQALMSAVSQGTGLAGWHGMTASFRASLPYAFMTGGAFIEHPGGEGSEDPYDVNVVDPDHEITQGVDPSFVVESEQYYMHLDPAVHVLATTTFTGGVLPHLDGVEMPVAYTKMWGKGRVFYIAVGHLPKDLANPPVARLVRQGLAWAARQPIRG
jgi:type 1 glutamine amidotransferase